MINQIVVHKQAGPVHGQLQEQQVSLANSGLLPKLSKVKFFFLFSLLVWMTPLLMAQTITTGTLESGNQTICYGGNPSAIFFAVPPSGSASFTYTWYFKAGIVADPTGSSTAGWTMVGTPFTVAAPTTLAYDPQVGTTASGTYACFVQPSAGMEGWASGARQITVLPVVNRGTLATGNQSLTGPADPANITFSTNPTGSGSFGYLWYYQNGIIAAPTGTVTTGWTSTGVTTSTFDPPAGLTASRSYACFVTPTGTPTCGTGAWSTGVRQITVPLVLGTIASGNQTLCLPGDPANIAFSAVPSGANSFTYAWYYKDGIVAAPTGSSVAGWTSAAITSQSYDPPAGLTASRTYACFVSPSQGTAAWATGARQITVNSLPAVTITSSAPIVTNQVITLAGSGTAGSSDGTGSAATFNIPYGVAMDAAGNAYVADYGTHKIRKITPTGLVSTLAGSGNPGSADGTGSAASFYGPTGVAVDASGNVYVADQSNNKIRKITPAGVVSTLAGSVTGISGSTNGTGSAASFNNPNGVAVDAAGNVYVADQYNHKIRKITPAGVVSTLAGSGGEGSVNGTGIAASVLS